MCLGLLVPNLVLTDLSERIARPKSGGSLWACIDLLLRRAKMRRGLRHTATAGLPGLSPKKYQPEEKT